MRLLIVDNHDSFTFNLVQLVEQATGIAPTVVSADTPWALADPNSFDAIIISPGPGDPARPADLSLSQEVIKRATVPLLGVCLGLQALVHLAGGRVERLPEPAHGVVDQVGIGQRPAGADLFAGCPDAFDVVRYHSLHATQVPAEFAVTAALADGTVMAIAHRTLPRWAVQFHPESVLSAHGADIVRNFVALARAHFAREHFCVRELGEYVEPAEIVARLPERGRVWLEAGRFHILVATTGPAAGPRTHALDADYGGALWEDWAADFERHRLPSRVGAPLDGLDFALGWVGYFGYAPAGVAPQAELAFVDRALICDTDTRTTYLLSFAGDDAWDLPPAPASRPAQPSAPALREWTLAHTRAQYLELIARAQEHMRAGDSYEVCLTTRASAAPIADMLAAHHALRAVSPSPRAGFVDLPRHQLASSSPELFLAVDSFGVAWSQPIKGTRPRHTDPLADAALAAELSGPKERAELLMVTDMVRHDLRTVCTRVEVPNPFKVKSFATVHQLMSDVCGPLAPGKTAIDALRAAFPGGSMSGAPKERTCQIIADLEDGERGVYSGAYGYLSVTGAADFSMTIRTIVNAPTGAYYGVGGAILVASDPAAEWDEVHVKLEALRRSQGRSQGRSQEV